MSYFHSTASGHKRRNFIMEIKDDDETHTDQTVKGRIFYCKLMRKESQPMPHINWGVIYNHFNGNSITRPISASRASKEDSWFAHDSLGINSLLTCSLMDQIINKPAR
jgi:hypothetical protein